MSESEEIEIWRKSRSHKNADEGIDAFNKVREVIPEFRGSILGRIANVAADVRGALEDVANRERIVADYDNAADYLEALVSELDNIWRDLYLARKHNLEETVVYGPIFPREELR